MKRILKHALVVIAVIAFALAVWFAGPLIGIGGSYPFDPVWVRLLLILPVVLIVATVYLIRWLRARKAEKALEDAIAEPQVTGDGEALGERMSDALEVLRRSSGSRSYLYDLPWYVIIGPPGAGKTTALLNSGIRFPLAEKTGGAMPGAGGTRYCDWWFAEDAVLIDTAGRYTTQDSDAEADAESWMSFLRLLKDHRTRQPINGVIVAMGLDDLLTATPDAIEEHAAAIRARLTEIHEVLRIDVPVYVMFTKADLIAGFSEFFGAFSASRRQKVWGATFETVERAAPPIDAFDREFELLCKRLSEDVTDRMHEEPDAVARIAIFGFPAQVAMLRDRLRSILDEVFGSSRYRVPATLRGFYFTSGTQEGTPIDQVLGAMERSFGMTGTGGGQSGMGKSYFLHDLLRKVIFAEAGLVSYDRKAARREAVLRYGSFGVLTAGAVAALVLWGVSFWNNRAMINAASAAAGQYETSAHNEIMSDEVSDPDLTRVAGHLQMLRHMPMGYGDSEDRNRWYEGFGFSQRAALRSAATSAYRDALEHMLRPRLLLRLEERIVEDIAGNDVLSLYESLKVYKLLGYAAPAPDDAFVAAWIVNDWATNLYPGGGQSRERREELEVHLWTMLELSARQSRARVDLNAALVDRAEQTLAIMNIEDQAYLLAKGAVTPRELPDFNIGLRAGPEAARVFETLDGRELNELTVPGVYTYQGFHRYFLPRLADVAEKLETEQWVMGERADLIDVSGQLSRLGPAIMNRYALDFVAAWNAAFDNLKLRPMSADPPHYQTLATAAAPRLSPIAQLVEAVVQETRLTADFTEEGGFGAEMGRLSEVADSPVTRIVDDHLTRQISSRVTGINRIGFDIVNAVRRQDRAGGGGGAGGAGGGAAQLPGANVEAQFARWHDLLEGDGRQRPIDALLDNFQRIHQLLILAATSPAQANQELNSQISILSSNATRLPPQLSRMVAGTIEEFAGDAANTTLATLNEKLNAEVTQVCERIVPDHYPFAGQSNRDLPLSEFARLFAPGGVFDAFFAQNLMPHADMSGNEWSWRADSRLGDRLSTATLRQFQRAADIRDAFFPGGSAIPGFDITIRQTAMHPEVETALLEVNGQVIATQQSGSLPQTIGWPSAGGGGSASIQLSPDMRDRDSDLRVQPGPWALMRLVNEGRPRPSGSAVDIRLDIGGRYIAYNINAASSLNPFFLRSLWDFRCPRGL